MTCLDIVAPACAKHGLTRVGGCGQHSCGDAVFKLASKFNSDISGLLVWQRYGSHNCAQPCVCSLCLMPTDPPYHCH
eukprot:COSAG01_NODE_4320_length_5136_cov_11.367282_1_plen_76_part_10